MNNYNISQKVKDVFAERSKKLKEITTLFTDTKYECVIIEIEKILNTLLPDEDPYFLCYLYSILIRIYISKKKSEKVIHYMNKILMLSGMVLTEYAGNFSPFDPQIINKVLKCYDQIINSKNTKTENTLLCNTLWGKARIYHLLNKWKDAHELYTKALEINNNNTMALQMFGRLFEDENKFSKALSLYKKIKKIDGNQIITCFIANVYIKLNNNEYAKELLEQNLVEYPNDTVTLFRLCTLYLFLKEQTNYEKTRKKLLALCPYNTKYYLFTTDSEEENTITLYKNIIDSMKGGTFYSVANRFCGDYFFFKNDYETAIKYYEAQLQYDPFSKNNYENILKTIYRLLNFASTNKELEEKYTTNISKIKQIFFYDKSFHLEYDVLNKSIDDIINLCNINKSENILDLQIYTFLLKLYKQKDEQSKIKDLIITIKNIFPESYIAYLESYLFNLNTNNYKEMQNDIDRLKQLSMTDIPAEKASKVYQSILLITSFYITPNNYFILKKKYQNKLTEKDYEDLLIFYYNNSYQKKYLQFALDCIKQINIPNEEDPDILYISSLILYISNEKNLAQKCFDRFYLLKGEKYTLLSMINIVGDILNINVLKDLFINSKSTKEYKSKELKELDFYVNAILYLLHYRYLKNSNYKQGISHYTSIDVLAKLIDENTLSKLRLSSIQTANDPKEGCVLIDYLTSTEKNVHKLNTTKNSSVKNIFVLQTSFTLLQDALTMFRLYGKRNNLEGTGVNIVFNSGFFSDDLKPPLESSNQEKLRDLNIDNNISKKIDISAKKQFDKLPLYFVLYYDKKNDKLVFNPFDIYEGSVLDLKKKVHWEIINQTENINSNKLKKNYTNNLIFLFQKLKQTFSLIPLNDLDYAKQYLLNIDYLIKDISFVDEKELRMIKIITKDQSNDILHDKDRFTLYYEYMNLLGMEHFCIQKKINKIILGPKVPEKNSIKEYIINHLNIIGLSDVEVSISEAPLA